MLRSQQMERAEHFCQGISSKEHLYGLKTSQSSHESHHYEELDLFVQTMIASDIYEKQKHFSNERLLLQKQSKRLLKLSIQLRNDSDH
jgi:hypothetical protein